MVDSPDMQERGLWRLLLVVAALMAGACAPADHRVADEAVLRATDEKWSATAAKNDLDGTVAYYSDDAVLLPPNGLAAKDAKSIRANWAGMLGPNSSVSWKPAKVEVAQAGDLGYVWGSYVLVIKDPKNPVDDRGKFVEVWRKQADGTWKCIVDTFNSDLPLPAAPAEKK